MKSEDLQKQGLTQEQIDFVMAENGKDLKKLQKANDDLTVDRDTWKEKAETAETTLKSFEGIDPENIQQQLDDWKQKAKDAEDNARAEIEKRDFADALKAALEDFEFTSEAARKAVMTEIKEAGLKLKNGKILGLSDLISQIQERDPSAFVDEEQENLEGGKARFTNPMNKVKKGEVLTKKDIMAIKDPIERQKKIAEHMDLFE